MLRKLGTLALAAVIAVCAAPQLAIAQAPPPASHLHISATALATLDSMANVARQTHKENALCLTGYVVDGDTLTLTRFAPATYTKTDSVSIYSDGPMCPDGQPDIHAHLMLPGYVWNAPSDDDLNSSGYSGVWDMLLVIPLDKGAWHVVLY